MSSTPNQTTSNSSTPRAIIHKQILDEASSNPDASIEELSAGISGASPDLVEKVLKEYGDPVEPSTNESVAENTSKPSEQSNGSESTVSFSNKIPSNPELTVEQRETIRAIAENPEATQRELAQLLDVSAATISNRVNSIEGFQWSFREKFVAELLPDELDTHRDGLETVERDEEEDRDGHEEIRIPQKIIHACVESERIHPNEELEVIKMVNSYYNLS